jgi:diaminopimelate decarboxylase
MPAATISIYPQASSVEDGRLVLGGCDAVELAREFGTPAYVVAEDDLRSRARAFLAALRAHHDGPAEVLFGTKAFPCTAALALFAEEGLGCDVASGGELHLALRAGFEPERLYLHGNAKSEAELRFAVDAGVGCIVIDSLDEIERLERLLPAGRTQRVLIRINPGVEADTHAAIATGHHDSKFGLPLWDAPEAIARTQAARGLELAGLHMHIGSQILVPGPWRAGVAALATLGDFPVYDLGGGLGVAYTEGDHPPTVEEYVEANASALRELVGPGRTLVMEIGRALTANAGVTLYRVESVKPGTRKWVAVDGGMSDNLRPMLYGARYDADIADRFTRGPDDGEPCTIVGKHCETGDVLTRDVRLRDPRPGDILVTPATGAYGHALANNYNSVPRPPVIFVAGGRARVVVRRETYEDLHARDV